MDFQEEPVLVSEIDGGFRVSVRGSVHVNTAWLEGELRRVADKKPKLVELDLSATPHVSSAGMGLFLASRRTIAAAGGTFRVVSIQKAVFGSFRFAGLDTVFQIEPSAVILGK